MEYYRENLEALEAYDKDAYEHYIAWENKEPELLVEEETARDGNKILNIIKEGKKYRLNSKYYPEKEAWEWAQSFDFSNLGQVVNIFGLGNGIFARALRKAGKEDMRLIIYEPSLEIFDYLMKNTKVGDIFKEKNTIVLVKGLNEKWLYGVLDTVMSWENVDFSVQTLHPQYNRIFEAEYEEYKRGVNEGRLRAKINMNTAGYFGKDMVYNIIGAIPYLEDAQLIEQYEEKFGEDIPAIIVAAGPSLDLNIEKLKLAKGKAVIMATDTAMRDLVKHKIEPDFIVTVDPKKPSEYLKQEECRDIPLICNDTANREILKHHRGRKIFMALSEFTQETCPERFKKGRKPGSGACVATVAFSACVFMNFKTIILVGQDLAYRDGISHAGGRMSGEEIHGSWLVEVEDIYGNRIKTRHEWYEFLKWFEDAIEIVKNKIVVIDATEGGAKIKGAKLMSLEAAIKQFCMGSIDCQALTERLGNAYTQEDYGKVVAYMKKAILDNNKNIKEIRLLLVDLERLLTLCEREQRGAEYKKLTQGLIKAGEKIMSRPVYNLAESWCADSVFKGLSAVNHLDEDKEKDEIELYKSTLEFYKKLREASIELCPILEEASKNMKIREDLSC